MVQLRCLINLQIIIDDSCHLKYDKQESNALPFRCVFDAFLPFQGWPAIEDNVVSKEFAELALLCIRQSKLANRIPLDELRKKLQV